MRYPPPYHPVPRAINLWDKQFLLGLVFTSLFTLILRPLFYVTWLPRFGLGRYFRCIICVYVERNTTLVKVKIINFSCSQEQIEHPIPILHVGAVVFLGLMNSDPKIHFRQYRANGRAECFPGRQPRAKERKKEIINNRLCIESYVND